jgi:ABC-type Zn uptake system ZnuABC Zn-binding protein ZnuA
MSFAPPIRLCNCVSSLLAGLFLLVAVLVPACGNPGENASGKPVVLCTIFSYYDAARAIAGDAADVHILLPRQTSPHDYEATLDDKTTASRAKLYIKNGMMLDDRFDKLIDGTSAKTLDISKAIPANMFLTTAEVSLDEKPNENAERLNNPHIWLDPLIQMRAAEVIRDALIAMEPSHKATFEANAQQYIEQLKKLDEDFKAAAATFKTKDFIGFHSAYEYLAHRYGLHQIASIEEIPGGGISLDQAAKIIDLIKKNNIHYIAMESALSGTGARNIEEATGVKTVILQPLETYDDPGNTYNSLMRQNLKSLETALGT